MVGVACVGVWVFASSVCFYCGAARLAAFALVTQVDLPRWLCPCVTGGLCHTEEMAVSALYLQHTNRTDTVSCDTCITSAPVLSSRYS